MSDDGPFRKSAKVFDVEIPGRWTPFVATLIATVAISGYILGHVCAATDPTTPTTAPHDPTPEAMCTPVCEAYGLHFVRAMLEIDGIACACGDRHRAIVSRADGYVTITDLNEGCSP